MAASGYEFYLLVLKVSLTCERYFQHSKIKFVSPRGHVISVKNIRPKLKILKTVSHMMKQSRQFLQCFASF